MTFAIKRRAPPPPLDGTFGHSFCIPFLDALASLDFKLSVSDICFYS